ncbi:unnamed protein product [Lathyrus oleraceus]
MTITPPPSDTEVSVLENKNLGRITQIIGPVLDVVFPPGKMPYIYNALIVQGRDTVGKQINVTCEVQQLLGNNRIRAVAMSATDGLKRGMEVIDTGACSKCSSRRSNPWSNFQRAWKSLLIIWVL